MWLCTFLVYPHTIQVWGIVAFILVKVLSEPLFNKRESTPHFLFFTNRRIGVATAMGKNEEYLLFITFHQRCVVLRCYVDDRVWL